MRRFERVVVDGDTATRCPPRRQALSRIVWLHTARQDCGQRRYAARMPAQLRRRAALAGCAPPGRCAASRQPAWLHTARQDCGQRRYAARCLPKFSDAFAKALAGCAPPGQWLPRFRAARLHSFRRAARLAPVLNGGQKRGRRRYATRCLPGFGRFRAVVWLQHTARQDCGGRYPLRRLSGFDAFAALSRLCATSAVRLRALSRRRSASAQRPAGLRQTAVPAPALARLRALSRRRLAAHCSAGLRRASKFRPALVRLRRFRAATGLRTTRRDCGGRRYAARLRRFDASGRRHWVAHQLGRAGPAAGDTRSGAARQAGLRVGGPLRYCPAVDYPAPAAASGAFAPPLGCAPPRRGCGGRRQAARHLRGPECFGGGFAGAPLPGCTPLSGRLPGSGRPPLPAARRFPAARRAPAARRPRLALLVHKIS